MDKRLWRWTAQKRSKPTTILRSVSRFAVPGPSQLQLDHAPGHVDVWVQRSRRRWAKNATLPPPKPSKTIPESMREPRPRSVWRRRPAWHDSMMRNVCHVCHCIPPGPWATGYAWYIVIYHDNIWQWCSFFSILCFIWKCRNPPKQNQPSKGPSPGLPPWLFRPRNVKMMSFRNRRKWELCVWVNIFCKMQNRDMKFSKFGQCKFHSRLSCFTYEFMCIHIHQRRDIPTCKEQDKTKQG